MPPFSSARVLRVLAMVGLLVQVGTGLHCERQQEEGRRRQQEKMRPVASHDEASGSVDIESLWTQVDGGHVHYLAAGPPDGRSVVFLHGGRFEADTWRHTGTLVHLAEHGYRAYAIDLPGFGRSPRAAHELDQWLGRLLDAMKIDGPVIVSPSMSGRYSLPLVTDRPKRVAGFVAVAPIGILAHQDKLSRITVPTLAIWGRNDRTVPIAQADLLVREVPNARKVVVPNAGHALYMDDADAFHKQLLAFLAELPAKSGQPQPG